jgi:hypothetical protein
MDPFHKHLIERITNLEIELNALREVTWPVCQSLWDKDGPFQNRKQKKTFFRTLFVGQVQTLLRLKALFIGTSPGLAVSELQWVLEEEPVRGEELV